MAYMLLRIVYTIAGVRPPWMRMSVPETVRSSMLIQFSPVGIPFVFPRDAANDAIASIPAGRPPPAMGRNPSGTSALAYFRYHQKYWCSGMPFSFNRALIAIPFSRASPWISSICSRISMSVCISGAKLYTT